MNKFSSVAVVSLIAICFSPVDVMASEEDATASLRQCISMQETVRDLQLELEIKDREILSSYSHYEVAERNAKRWNRAVLANSKDVDAETSAFEWEIQKDLKLQSTIDGMYSRKLKTQRLRNMLVSMRSCKTFRFPKAVSDKVCDMEGNKNTFYCQTHF